MLNDSARAILATDEGLWRREDIPQLLHRFSQPEEWIEEVLQAENHPGSYNLRSKHGDMSLVIQAEALPGETGAKWGTLQLNTTRENAVKEPGLQYSQTAPTLAYRQLFEAYMRNAPYESVVIDSDHKIVFFNKRSADKVRQRDGLELMPGLSIDEFRTFNSGRLKELLKICSREGYVRFNTAIKDGKGEVEWFNISLFRISFPEISGEHFYILNGIDITEMRRSVALLRESEENFNFLFESSPIGLVMFNENGQAIAVSSSLEGIFKKSLSSLHKADWFELLQISPQQIEAQGKMLRSSLKLETGSPVAPDATILSVTSHILDDGETGKRRYLSAVTDDTERYQQERELHRYEQRLAIAAQFAGVATWEYYEETGRMLWDDQMWKVFDRQKQGRYVSFDFFRRCIHPQDEREVTEDFWNSIQEKGSFHKIFRIVTEQHRILYLETYAQRVKIGEDWRIVGINYDVTEESMNALKINELNQELKSKEKRLSAILEKGKDAVIIHDENGLIIDCTSSVYNVSGYRPEELLGTYLDDHFSSAQYLSDEQWQRFLKTPGESFTIESNFTRKDGKHITVESNVTNLLHDSSIRGIVSNFRDITLRTQTLQEKQRAIRISQEMNQLKNNFLANMSHELRTPLNALLGISELLEKKFKEDPETTELVSMQQESAERLLNTLTGLINFSRLDANLERFHSESIDIQEVLEKMIEDLQPKLKAKGQKIDFIKLSRKIEVTGEPTLLMDSFKNILLNASKFSDEGTITIRVSLLDADWVQIEFIDRGIGIAKNDQSKIFKPFQQVNLDWQHRQYQGSGLGLAIVKKYIELLGGEIKLESEPGKGSNFKILLHLDQLS